MPQPAKTIDPQGITAAPADEISLRYDVRILRSLRAIIRSVDLYSRELAVTNQITAPQLVCLLNVVENGEVTATSIGRDVHLSPSTVVGILDRLEDKGLVDRQRSQEDRRQVRVSATQAGRELARTAPSPLQQTLAKALIALPELEQATIALALERVVALMEAPPLDYAPMLTTGPIIPPEAGS